MIAKKHHQWSPRLILDTFTAHLTTRRFALIISFRTIIRYLMDERNHVTFVARTLKLLGGKWGYHRILIKKLTQLLKGRAFFIGGLDCNICRAIPMPSAWRDTHDSAPTHLLVENHLAYCTSFIDNSTEHYAKSYFDGFGYQHDSLVMVCS